MYFLIDFENVKNAGMRGTEYLLSTDYVIVFYSADTPTMEQRHLMNIQNSSCGFETYKLLMKRKNGLDFYIATKVGELFGADRIRAYRKTVDIGNFYAAYQEKQKLQQILRDAFAGTAFEGRLNEIEDVLKTGSTPKVIYLDSLRHFGRKEGQEVYRILKNCTAF